MAAPSHHAALRADGLSVGDDDDLLDDILDRGAVHSVYQPIVELDSGAVVGYEALARGPAGPLEHPAALFTAAARAGRLGALDRACMDAALRGARAAGLAAPWALFVNTEPAAAGDVTPPAGRAEDPALPVVLELTERALTNRPAQLLQLVARARAVGWGIALDDVGADRDSLALLPLVRPDVIKLDLRLVQQQPTADVAAIMNAVNAEAERSGTSVLAEGVETAEHLDVARALGATLGQGWRFGRPGPLPVPVPIFRGRSLEPAAGDEPAVPSAFAVAAAVRPSRPARKALLIEVSKHLEHQAADSGESAVVLASFQHARHFTPPTRRRYAELADRAAFVAALGEGMPTEPLPGVRGGVLHPGDPLVGEWDIAVLGPHFAATLVARDLGDSGPDAARRFAFVLSHDRALTITVAHALMSRIEPAPAKV